MWKHAASCMTTKEISSCILVHLASKIKLSDGERCNKGGRQHRQDSLRWRVAENTPVTSTLRPPAPEISEMASEQRREKDLCTIRPYGSYWWDQVSWPMVVGIIMQRKDCGSPVASNKTDYVNLWALISSTFRDQRAFCYKDVARSFKTHSSAQKFGRRQTCYSQLDTAFRRSILDGFDLACDTYKNGLHCDSSHFIQKTQLLTLWLREYH